ncbi:DNA repair protein RecO [Abyssisolibacter fermentans]|uniref:DNA repair protein RecO n=1 Tax=Abyssisolibacter fermentans TaxID=1766203 RepID=UPI000836E7C7|nr:DNA repair protein RecO [Abyssisolibacter fermentans]
MLLKLEGVVLRQTKYSDSDKILTIFTKEYGKIQAIAKGSRRQKSKLFASSQILTLSNFVVYKGKKMHNINQGDICKSFYPIKENLDKLSYAMYLVELINASILENEQNEKVYYLLIKTLEVLSIATKDYKKIILAFELKYMSFIGYKPSLKVCAECRENYLENAVFSCKCGGVLCSKCRNIHVYDFQLNNTLLKNLQLLLYSKLDELDNIEIEDKQLEFLEKIMKKYISYYIDKKEFNALKFMQYINPHY